MQKQKVKQELSDIEEDVEEIGMMLEKCSDSDSVDEECKEISRMLERL